MPSAVTESVAARRTSWSWPVESRSRPPKSAMISSFKSRNRIAICVRPSKGSTQTHVDDLIGHLLIDDHLVLRVDGDLGIVADGDLGMRRHGAAVGIGERHLAFAALFQRGKMRRIFTTLLFQRRDLFRQILDPRTAGRVLLGIACVEP